MPIDHAAARKSAGDTHEQEMRDAEGPFLHAADVLFDGSYGTPDQKVALLREAAAAGVEIIQRGIGSGSAVAPAGAKPATAGSADAEYQAFLQLASLVSGDTKQFLTLLISMFQEFPALTDAQRAGRVAGMTDIGAGSLAVRGNGRPEELYDLETRHRPFEAMEVALHALGVTGTERASRIAAMNNVASGAHGLGGGAGITQAQLDAANDEAKRFREILQDVCTATNKRSLGGVMGKQEYLVVEPTDFKVADTKAEVRRQGMPV